MHRDIEISLRDMGGSSYYNVYVGSACFTIDFLFLKTVSIGFLRNWNELYCNTASRSTQRCERNIVVFMRYD